MTTDELTEYQVPVFLGHYIVEAKDEIEAQEIALDFVEQDHGSEILKWVSFGIVEVNV